MKNTLKFLTEFRKRILRYLLLFGIVFGCLSFFTNEIYHLFAIPFLKQVSNDVGLIAISVPAPFLVPLKSVFVVSVFITIPFLFYQLWMFIAPALYPHEKKQVWILLLASSLLFYCGVLFAYFLVLPMMFQFFIHMAPAGVVLTPDISEYFSFILSIFFAFGFAFELPVIIVLLVWSGISSVESLADKRPFIIIFVFIMGMLLTPPDVVSQILLAVPLWLLFESSLFLARFIVPKESKSQESV